MELSSGWAKAMENNILKFLHEGLATHPDSSAELFNVIDSSQAIYRFHDSWGPRQIGKSSEGAATSELDRQKGYETTANPQVFKNKVSASSEWIRWNQYPQIYQDSKDLGEAAIYSINLFGAGVLINAFSTSYTSYGDALPLCSSVHTRPDGGSTQGNGNTSGITLTETNEETAVVALKQQLSGTGRKLNVAGGRLTAVVPEQLEKEAVIINDSKLRSGTANNDLNWYLGRVSVFVHPFIGADVSDLDGNSGSDTAWYLMVRGQHGLTFIWDKRPIYRSWEDEDTDAMYTKIYFSCQTAWQHWYALYGSKGDGASYSS